MLFFYMKHAFFLNFGGRIKPKFYLYKRSPLCKVHRMLLYSFMQQFSHKCSKFDCELSVNALCCELLL